MNKDIKVIFEIKQGDEIFTIGDYVEIIPKDLVENEICAGHINNESNSKFLVLDDDLMFKNEIPYSEISKIKPII